jgi:hypothetical protein
MSFIVARWPFPVSACGSLGGAFFVTIETGMLPVPQPESGTRRTELSTLHLP